MEQLIATPEAFTQRDRRSLERSLPSFSWWHSARGARPARSWLFPPRRRAHVARVRVGTALAVAAIRRHFAKLLVGQIDQVEPGLGIEAMTLVAPLIEPLAAAAVDLAASAERRPISARWSMRSRTASARRTSTAPGPGPAACPSVRWDRPARWKLSSACRWADDLPRPGRLLDPPQPIQVTAMLPDHPPAMFVWGRKRYRVVQADGERLHGEWWRGQGHEARQPFAVRDYFQVEVEEAAATGCSARAMASMVRRDR